MHMNRSYWLPQCWLQSCRFRGLPSAIRAKAMVVFTATCFAVLALAGCNDTKQARIAKLNKLDRECSAIYFGTNVHSAFEAVLSHQRSLADIKETKLTGVNFDYLLAADAARLYYMSLVLGQTNHAKAYLSESVHYFKRAFPEKPHGTDADEEEKLTRFVLDLDGPKALWMRTTNAVKERTQ